MKKIISGLAIALVFNVSAQQDVMTPEKLWELGRVSLETVSPDGQQFIYGITRYNIDQNKGDRNLFSMSIKGGESLQLTDKSGSEYGAFYLKNGSKIGYSSGGQFHVMDLDGNNSKALTSFEGGISNVNAYDLADGRIALLFTRSVKMEKTTLELYPNLPKAEVIVIDNLMYRHWDSWSDAEYNHICIAYVDTDLSMTQEYVDIMPKEKFDSPVNPFGGSESFTLSPDGSTIVYEAKKLTGKDWAVSTNSDLYAYDIKTKTTKNITSGMNGYDKEPKYSPDGKSLAWLSMATPGYESDVNNLMIMNVATNEKTDVLKTIGKYDDITFSSYSWVNNKTIYTGVPIAGVNQIYKLNLKNLKKGKPALTAASEGDFNHNHYVVSGKQIILDRQDMNNATEVYSIQTKNKKETQLTHVNDDIYASLGKGKVEKRMITTSDGKSMLTWVVYPPNFDPNKKYPTLLYCQGGPQSQVSQFYSFRWNFQLMAAQGYIVVAPNRRGLPGYGREWNEEISGDWGGQAMKDYLSAIDELKKEPYVDEDKLGCIGASYGGYSVYYLAGNHEKRFKTFISHCGLFDLESWYLSTEELFFANQDLGGPYWNPSNAKTYQKFDPKDYVQNWDTPILVIHGGKDFRVPENQGIEAFQAAQLKGIPSKFLYFPNEGHWILSPQNGLIWHDQFFGWLDQWLK